MAYTSTTVGDQFNCDTTPLVKDWMMYLIHPLMLPLVPAGGDTPVIGVIMMCDWRDKKNL